MAATSRCVNALGQRIGDPLPVDWRGAEPPSRQPLVGQLVLLEPLTPEQHAAGLFEAWSADRDGRIFTYMPFGPFSAASEVRAWIESNYRANDPLFFAIRAGPERRPLGIASYLRIKPGQGSIEVGWICYGPELQRTPAATETMFLMMENAFDRLRYRRYEWKCDALNGPSRRAAERLGFAYEGVFRQATHYKGRNRDTAWYAIIDRDWPTLREVYRRWLDPVNFDSCGRQRTSLSTLAAAALGEVRAPG